MKRKEIFAFCFNICILLLTIIGIVDFSTAETTTYTVLKWFTTDSNLLLGMSVIISITYMICKWNGKVKNIPQWVDIVKLTTTAMVTLTMFVTIFYLTPVLAINKSVPVLELYSGSNLIYHIFNPIIAIVTFLLFENRKDIKGVKTLYALIPTIIYVIFYTTMAATHMGSDGKPLSGYDWYGFLSYGVLPGAFLTIGIVGLYYLFAWALWYGNRKINIKSLNK